MDEFGLSGSRTSGQLVRSAASECADERDGASGLDGTSGGTGVDAVEISVGC